MRLSERNTIFKQAVQHQLGGRVADALPLYDAVLRLDPTLAAAFCNRAIALQSLDRLDEALNDYDHAIALQPDYADAHYNKAIALKRLDRVAEAARSYESAIALKPNHAEALANLGNALRELDRPSEALQCFDCALAISPELADAHLNRANALVDLKRLREALQGFENAIALRPNFVEALYNKSTCTLLSGDWDAGWPLYEWRKNLAMAAGLHNYPGDEWRGEVSLAGKTLFIHAEQGLGDTIQFCRYALLAQKKGAHVILSVQDCLVRLFKSFDPHVEIAKQSSLPASFSHHVALLSMPLVSGTALANCPAPVPYLRAEPERVAMWKSRIGDGGFKVGICWQGGKQSPIDIGRSFPVRDFEAIAQIPNVRLISLQKNDGVEQLADLPPGMTVEILGEEFDTGPDAFIDTAAVMECLDLVITSDTAVAHLAGALGRPTWVALKYVPDWRWLLDRADSPWYPTVKLFRQAAPGDWASVFAAMRAELTELPAIQLKAVPAIRDIDALLAGAADCYNSGRLADALTLFDAVIRLNPANAIAHCNRGLVLQTLQRIDDAIASYERAIQLEPCLVEAHYNRGNALRDARQLVEALESYGRALSLNPYLAEAHHNKGNVLQDLGRFEEAMECFDRALALEPADAAAYIGKGSALQKLSRFDAALRSIDRAIVLRPGSATAHNNRGNILRDLRRLDEAYQSYARAAELEPGLVDAHWNKATSALLSGNYAVGWPLYESRKRKFATSRFDSYSGPIWSGGEGMENKTLFVYAEQGLGDTIQFCRYVVLARQRGARVVFAVQDKLMRLLTSLGPEIEIIPQMKVPPAFDFHIALMSMPLAFDTALGSVPAEVPYLRAEVERVARWKSRIGSEGLRIGICWQGNAQSGTDPDKSFSLRHFESIARMPGVRLISLQKDDGVEQLENLPSSMNVETLGEEFDAGPDAFADTAAVMECLDLVITSDTAIAHLAGALGRPAWVALKHVPDWRWLLDRSDSPWYPTLKLFRQTAPGDWTSVFAAMEARLVDGAKGSAGNAC